MKITIITPTLNAENHIEKAVKSVLSQNYHNFEHIIVDGRSTDKTLEILKDYPHLLIISEKDSGQVEAMNKGFNISTGEVIVYLNSDDYFYDDVFNKVSKAFEKNNEADVVVGNLDILNFKNKINTQNPNIELPELLKHWKRNAFPHNPLQYFYKRQVQEGIPFNKKNDLAMDHEFLIEVAKNFNIIKINYTFGLYRTQPGSKTFDKQLIPETYWTIDNFSYIDRFLNSYSKEFIIDFKNQQNAFFTKKLLESGTKSSFPNQIIQKLKNLYSTNYYKRPFTWLKKYLALKLFFKKNIGIYQLQNRFESHLICKNSTDLLVEGYPRSGNTFTVRQIKSLVELNNKSLDIAHHTHSIENLRLAKFHNTPSLILIRKPSEAILSHFIFQNYDESQSDKVDDMVNKYIAFYKYAKNELKNIVFCEFNVVKNNFNFLIRELNSKFNLSIPESTNLEFDKQIVFDGIKSLRNLEGANFVNEIAIPNIDREEKKSQYRKLISTKSIKANSIYQEICSLDNTIIDNEDSPI